MRVNSLTTRFLIALLLCTAVPFVAFGLYVRSEVRDREEKQGVSVYLPRWADDAARRIGTKLDAIERVGSTLAGDAETYSRREDEAYLDEHIGSLWEKNRDFDMVIFADEDGKVLEAMRNPIHDESPRYYLEPKSVADLDWFKAINSEGGPVQFWEPRHVSKFLHSETEESKDPTFYNLGVAFGVQMKEGPYGVFFILLSWGEIVQKVLDDTTRFLNDNAGFPSAKVFLCDAEGQVLAHSDRGRYGTVLPESVREKVLGGDADPYVQMEGEERQGLGIASLKPYMPGDGFDWYVVLSAPTRELFEVSREFGRWLLFIIPAIALLVAALALLTSREIVRPVRELSAATHKVAQGDLNTRVRARGGDELADLGRAFNTMAEDLAESREQLRDAERQAAWAEMARQIAHEIKNPLTPMRMAAQMLLRARRESDPRWPDLSERLARNVLQQTDALDRIAADFQQFAGSPARDIEIVAADDLLGGVEELLLGMAESSSVVLTFVPGAGDLMVAVDVQEMRRVFLNLIHNAMQAGADANAGEVCVRSSASSAVRSPTGVGTDGTVEFRVEDNGAGVPDEMRTKLFDPYFTTKTAGTGLGLAICRRIVEAHGGDIKLESSAPPRTVFLVSLPVAQAPAG